MSTIPNRTIWPHPTQENIIQIIDQRRLPHEIVIEDLLSCADCEIAIKEMHVRGAPLIGVTAAFGLHLATLAASANNWQSYLEEKAISLKSTRPTAINLNWAVDKVMADLRQANDLAEARTLSLQLAKEITEADVASCKAIGEHGLTLILSLYQELNRPIQILTHCNAGRLGCVEYGTATAPMYLAQAAGIPIHVWVDETRPRNQGANLTAWELGQAGISHHVIVDNTGGHLMQHGMVDIVFVGSDRTTTQGDVANKIGTYLKALAAKDNNIPFYVALPSSTIDFSLSDGLKDIPIEERSPDEVRYVEGWDGEKLRAVRIVPESSPAVNYGFDVTPARLVTGLITERGICAANEAGILQLFQDVMQQSIATN
jgi:methylthioribose-1-phosphate isomerase